MAELDEGVFTADQAKTFVRSLLPLVEETGCVVVRADFAGDAKTQRLEEPNLPVVIGDVPDESRRAGAAGAGFGVAPAAAGQPAAGSGSTPASATSPDGRPGRSSVTLL